MLLIDGATYLSNAQITAPGSEPVTLAEAKAHSRIDTSADDTIITSQLLAAREYIEALIKAPLIQRSYRLRLDCFPSGNTLMLPGYPVVSVTAIRYIDNTGTQQTMSSGLYSLNADQSPCRVALNRSSLAWPSVYVSEGLWAVEVEYVAGYANAAAVPQALKQAMLLVFGHWYDNARETASPENLREVPHAVDTLCKTFVRTRWWV
jgi:uncharacterized phiE125 gp8 family phage protein